MSLSQSLYFVFMWVSVRRVVLYRCLLSRASIEDFNLFSSLLSSIRDLETEGDLCSLSLSLSLFPPSPSLLAAGGSQIQTRFWYDSCEMNLTSPKIQLNNGIYFSTYMYQVGEGLWPILPLAGCLNICVSCPRCFLLEPLPTWEFLCRVILKVNRRREHRLSGCLTCLHCRFTGALINSKQRNRPLSVAYLNFSVCMEAYIRVLLISSVLCRGICYVCIVSQ